MYSDGFPVFPETKIKGSLKNSARMSPFFPSLDGAAEFFYTARCIFVFAHPRDFSAPSLFEGFRTHRPFGEGR
jgi:hypothetical protein